MRGRKEEGVAGGEFRNQNSESPGGFPVPSSSTPSVGGRPSLRDVSVSLKTKARYSLPTEVFFVDCALWESSSIPESREI